MKNKSIVLLMVLLLSNSVFAENLTQVNVKKAKGIIDEAVAAYGGAKQLSSMNTVMIEHETINIATGQSLKPEPHTIEIHLKVSALLISKTKFS